MIKKPLLLMFATMLVLTTSAQSQSREEHKLLATLYYKLNEVFAPKAELDKLIQVIEMLSQDPNLKVQIEGYGDSLGGEAVNERVSQSRAQRVADYLIKHNVAESQISFVGYGIDTSAESDAMARRVDVSQIITVVIEPSPKHEKEIALVEEDARATERADNIDTDIQVEPEQTENNLQLTTYNSNDVFSLRTNLLYWLSGIINVGVEYKKNSFGYLINGGYSPFENNDWNYNLGGWFVAPEIRYYIGEKEAWFVGAQFLAGGYNIKLSDIGRIGTVVGGGVTGGYKLTLSERLDMDFSVGFGYGTLDYDTYYKHDNGTSIYMKKDITKNTLMPVQLGISLIFKLGVNN